MWFGTKFAFKLCKTQLSKINLKFYPKWAMFQKKRGSKRLHQYQKNIFSFFCGFYYNSIGQFKLYFDN